MGGDITSEETLRSLERLPYYVPTHKETLVSQRLNYFL
jgi:hypothetical protein